MRIGPCPKYVVLPFGLVQKRTGNRAGDWYVSSTNRLLIAPVHVFYQMCAWRIHRCAFLPTLPRPIRNPPERRSCTRRIPFRDLYRCGTQTPAPDSTEAF